jgi:hypothetical protein
MVVFFFFGALRRPKSKKAKKAKQKKQQGMLPKRRFLKEL